MTAAHVGELVREGGGQQPSLLARLAKSLSLSESELHELPRLLALEASKAPPRPELTPEERRRLRDSLRALHQEHARRVAELDAAAAAAEAARAKAEAEAVRARNERATTDTAFCASRDDATERLWAGRPALADELIAQAQAEAQSEEGREMVTIPSRFAANAFEPSRTVTNGESRRRRGRALLGLAEAVREWCANGEVTDDAELHARYQKAYAGLPRVEGVREVLAKDVRGSEVLERKFLVRTGPPERGELMRLGERAS